MPCRVKPPGHALNTSFTGPGLLSVLMASNITTALHIVIKLILGLWIIWKSQRLKKLSLSFTLFLNLQLLPMFVLSLLYFL